MIQNTTIEKYKIGLQEIFVKREDLACSAPGPPFAKVRGLYPVLKKLKAQGITHFGYMDTSISMAGWGLSYFCKKMGLKAVIFYPVYKNGKRHNQEFQIKKWKEFGATIIPFEKPNRLMINWYRARKILKEGYPDSEMLPQGLPFEETIEKVSDEVKKDFEIFQKIKTIVLCIGSGTMASGILRGLHSIIAKTEIYGIVVAPKDTARMKKKIYNMAGVDEKGFFAFKGRVNIIDHGFQYTDKEMIECPFPCNPYYDLKAWKWMVENIDKIEHPALFWNVGA